MQIYPLFWGISYYLAIHKTNKIKIKISCTSWIMMLLSSMAFFMIVDIFFMFTTSV